MWWRVRVAACALLAMFLLAAVAVEAPAATTGISLVRILRVTQAPYQPVEVRLWVKAPVGHSIFIAIKVFDATGHVVYTAKQGSVAEADYTQPYYSTSLTLKWNKHADDGSRMPQGQQLILRAYVSDISSGSGLIPSSIYRFTLSS